LALNLKQDKREQPDEAGQKRLDQAAERERAEDIHRDILSDERPQAYRRRHAT
jgi:hypothetical protein